MRWAAVGPRPRWVMWATWRATVPSSSMWVSPACRCDPAWAWSRWSASWAFGPPVRADARPRPGPPAGLGVRIGGGADAGTLRAEFGRGHPPHQFDQPVLGRRVSGAGRDDQAGLGSGERAGPQRRGQHRQGGQGPAGSHLVTGGAGACAAAASQPPVPVRPPPPAPACWSATVAASLSMRSRPANRSLAIAPSSRSGFTAATSAASASPTRSTSTSNMCTTLALRSDRWPMSMAPCG
jgi:hypothetical protein